MATFSVFSRMGLGTQSGQILVKQLGSDYGVTMSIGPSGITFSGDFFTYSNIMFVDNKGQDPPQYEFGNFTSPWLTINSALSYLESNNLVDKTIYVFPGTYTFSSSTISNSVNIHLLPGVTLNASSNFLDVDNCKVSISSESKRDCKISVTNGYFSRIRNEGHLSILNTSVVVDTNNTSAKPFGLTAASSGPDFLSFKDCYIRIHSSTPSTIFSQSMNSALYMDNCSLYCKPILGQKSFLFHLANETNGEAAMQLGLKNTKVFLDTSSTAFGDSMIFSIPFFGRPTNFVMIQNCMFQSADDTMVTIKSDNSSFGGFGDDGATYVFTIGNSIFSSQTFSNYDFDTSTPNFYFSDPPVTISSFTHSSIYRYTTLRSLPPPFEIW